MEVKYTGSPFLKVLIDKYKSIKDMYFLVIFGFKYENFLDGKNSAGTNDS